MSEAKGRTRSTLVNKNCNAESSRIGKPESITRKFERWRLEPNYKEKKKNDQQKKPGSRQHEKAVKKEADVNDTGTRANENRKKRRSQQQMPRKEQKEKQREEENNKHSAKVLISHTTSKTQKPSVQRKASRGSSSSPNYLRGVQSAKASAYDNINHKHLYCGGIAIRSSLNAIHSSMLKL
ncbi:hypothetical protein CHS0354_001923 [Potamilus streckersoni]|uniref:Uncharacterized protein n=1 Tax=Potamilus streckersoni TaxID=2493646 RepID=A0AAE0VS41_9BIVA|nr:hypothetical protein CHS0354_001923 [Potamilus streckersoni]